MNAAPRPISRVRQDVWNLPNLLTFGRIAVIPLICGLMMTGDRVDAILASVVFGLAGFTDWLDGYIARKRNLVSLTGKFLDPLADKLLVMAVLIVLIPLGRMPEWLVIVLIAREISITSLRALAAGEGLIIASAMGGKWKAGFQFVAITCLIIDHAYVVDYGLFTLEVRFQRIGLVLLTVSVVYALTSGWEYFRGFLAAIDAQEPDAAA